MTSDILEQLTLQENQFQHPKPGTSIADIEAMFASDFIEIGASGKVYNRQQSIDVLNNRAKTPRVESDWNMSGVRCIEISTDSYLLTYTLIQADGRVTKRASIWRKHPQGWQVLHHQGTIATE